MKRFSYPLSAIVLILILLSCAGGPQGTIPPTGADLDGGEFPAGSFFTLTGEALRRAVEAVQPADKDVQVVYREVRFRIDEQGRIETRYRWLFRVLSQIGVDTWSGTRVSWSSWYQDRPELRVRVSNPDGSQRSLEAASIIESSVAEESLRTYSDRRMLRAPFPAVTLGSIVEEEITLREHRPFFAAGHVLSWFPRLDRPVHLNRLIIEVPRQLPFSYRVELLPDLSPVKVEEGGLVTYLFEERDSPAEEQVEANLPYDHPHWPQVTFTTGTTWQAVAVEYARVVEQQLAGFSVPAGVPPAVTGDPRATAAAYMTWMNRRLRYTSLALGDRSIVPSSPRETLERGFGDCKDKAVLLVALMRAAGFRADVALLNSGNSWDVQAELPGFGEFNHAIVYVHADPPLWIDATADFSDGLILPVESQGRNALVVAARSEGLQKTPIFPSATNTVRQSREYRLAAKGYADVVETTTYTGTLESYFRRKFADQDMEGLREEWQKDYIPGTYRFGELTSSSVSDPYDLEAPFTVRLEIAKAGRAITEKTTASAAILEPKLLDWLPKAFTEEVAAPRQGPFQFYQPFVVEQRFRIVPPLGYKLRELPAGETYSMGPISIRRTSSLEPVGCLSLVLTLDSGEPQLRAEEFQTARARAQEYAKRSALLVEFDHQGARLAAEGDYAAAIAAFKDLISLDPLNAHHSLLLSETLLAAGLGEEAALTVRKVLERDPSSAEGWAALGWILQHDQAGRRFHPGFDRPAAIAAYARAVELDGESWFHKANLAILLEHDAEGHRYSAEADLAGAIEWYEKLQGSEGAKRMSNNYLAALFWAGRYPQVRRNLDRLEDPDSRLTYKVACLAAERGVEAALVEALAINPPDKRRKILAAAGDLLSNRRLYARAAALLREAAQGSGDAMRLESFADIRARTVPFEQLSLSPADPGSVIKAYIAAVVRSGGRDFAALNELVSVPFFHRGRQAGLVGSFEQEYMRLRNIFIERKMVKEASLDVLLSGLSLSAEGNPQKGYHVRLAGSQDIGAPFFYLAPSASGLLLAGAPFYESEIGAQIADFIGAGNSEAAGQWLDWMVEDYSAIWARTAKKDRFAGLAFFQFWDRDRRDPELMEYAAAALMALGGQAKRAVPILERGRSLHPQRATDFDLALTYAYLQLDRFDSAARSARNLQQADPDSAQALLFLLRAGLGAGRPEQAAGDVLDWLDRHPDHEDNARLLLLLPPSTYPAARLDEVFSDMERRNTLTASDYNSRAWLYLFQPPVSAEALRYARTAVSMTKESNQAVLHTMAALYAEVGRCGEAKQILDRVMQLSGRLAPESEEWYVLGRIAEQYGLLDAAERAYRLVSAPEPGEIAWYSSHVLARRRLQAMGRLP